jgi:hypothetical protein
MTTEAGGVPALIERDRETIIELVGPAIQAVLTGPAAT